MRELLWATTYRELRGVCHIIAMKVSRNVLYGIVLLFFLLLLNVPSISAQPWLKSVDNRELNYYQIIEEWQEDYEQLADIKGSGYKQFKRWEHYWKYRVDLSGSFPNPRVKVEEVAEYKRTTPVSKISSSSIWQSLGPNFSLGGYSGIGRINRIAVHPSNANIMYVTSAGGGLWGTKDRGASWAPLTDKLPMIHTTGIIIDRDNPNTLFLSTGDLYMRSLGIYTSTDAGLTWSPGGLNSIANLNIRNLRQHPTNSSLLYAVSNLGLYRSSDKGVTWSKMNTGYTNDLYDLEFSPSNPNTQYLSKQSYNFDTSKWETQIMQSLDSGSSWATRLIVSDGRRAEIAVSAQDANYVYVVMANANGALMGIYRSTDGGNSFELATNTPNMLAGSSDGTGTTGQGWYDLTILVSPTNKNEVIVGGINLWKSTDAGSTWSLTSFWHNGAPPGVPVVHADQHELIIAGPSTYVLANDGGIYISQNSGRSWTDISNGLVISQAYRVGVSQLDSKIIMGLQDNGTKILGTDGNWIDRIGGDGMDCEIDPWNPNLMYGTWQNGNLQRSTNGGLTFQTITPVGASRGNWVSPIELSPMVPNKLYFGTDEVYMSTNSGTTWTSLTSQLENTKINHIVASPTLDGSLYVNWGNKLFHTNNDGVQWIELNLPVTNKNVTYLTVDPNNTNTLYITLGGYGHKEQVFRGVFNGVSGIVWKNISYNLPSINTNTIEVDYAPGNFRIFVGMDAGIYLLDEVSETWFPYDFNLPNVEVRDLEIRASDRMLVAGTYGRGLWVSPLPDAMLSSSNVTSLRSNVDLININQQATVTAQAPSFGQGWLTIARSAASSNSFTIVQSVQNNSQSDLDDSADNVSIRVGSAGFGGVGTITLRAWATDKMLTSPSQLQFLGINSSKSVTIQVVEAPTIYGNIDGDGLLSPVDVSQLLQFIVNLRELTPTQRNWVDVNFDGAVNSVDASYLLQKLITPSFCLPAAGTCPSSTLSKPETKLIWEKIIINNAVFYELRYNGKGDVYSIEISLREAFDDIQAWMMPISSWMHAHNNTGGVFKLAMAGSNPSPGGSGFLRVPFEHIQKLRSENFAKLELNGFSLEAPVLPVSTSDNSEYADLPIVFRVDANFPNPFNPTTTLRVELPQASDVDVTVYDLTGRVVMKLPARSLQAGRHSITLDASMLGSGVYVYRVSTGTWMASGKMTLVK